MSGIEIKAIEKIGIEKALIIIRTEVDARECLKRNTNFEMNTDDGFIEVIFINNLMDVIVMDSMTTPEQMKMVLSESIASRECYEAPSFKEEKSYRDLEFGKKKRKW